MIPNDPQSFTRRSLVDAFAEALAVNPTADPAVLLAEMLGVAPSFSAKVRERGDCEAVFAAWLESTGRKAKFTDNRRALIRRRLRDYPASDLVAAVRGWRHDPFHCGHNPSLRVFNDIELLLRDAAHVERFRDLEVAHGNGTHSQVASLLHRIRTEAES